MALTPISETPAPGVTKGVGPWRAAHPVWQLGFRPFYLLAALFAAISIPLWLASYLGWLHGALQVGLDWHMHEMVFGFALAVVVGFLYTAGRNWTGLPTPHGGHLMALAGLWLAGRVAMLCSPALVPALAAALVEWLFLPLAAWPLYRVLRRAGNTRNLFLVGLLALLALANGLYHAVVLGWLALSLFLPVQAAIFIIVLIESVIGARVIPMFTRNGAPGSTSVASPQRAMAAVACMAAASIAWLAGAPGWLAAPLSAVAASMSLANLLAWQPQRTLRVPLLWILHLSYAWIGIGFALLAAASLGVLPASAALHALTVGSMAGLIIGMMTRTTLGHTGRPLKAGRAEAWMYWLIQLGALARLLAAAGLTALVPSMLLAAGLCWSLAFALFVLAYAPRLWRPRVDGREG